MYLSKTEEVKRESKDPIIKYYYLNINKAKDRKRRELTFAYKVPRVLGKPSRIRRSLTLLRSRPTNSRMGIHDNIGCLWRDIDDD